MHPSWSILSPKKWGDCSDISGGHCRSSSSGYGVRGSHDSDGLQAASQVPEVIGDELPPTLLEVCSGLMLNPTHDMDLA